MFYIEELEKQISLGVPRNFKEALRLAYEQQEIIETLQLESKIKDQQISELQPKASYYDYVLQCKGVVAISIIAKDFGIKSGQELNKLLHKLGIQFNQGGVWLLYSKYADKGYTQTKTHPYFRTDGTPDSRVQTYWTQKGRLFLYELLKNNGYLPNIEKEYSKEAQRWSMADKQERPNSKKTKQAAEEITSGKHKYCWLKIRLDKNGEVNKILKTPFEEEL